MVCQTGAEAAAKAEILGQWPAFRFAYSRPGFLTFKLAGEAAVDPRFDLRSTFARCYGFTFGKLKGENAAALVGQLGDLLGDHSFDQLHVWQRDAAVPGDRGFEPAVTPLATTIGELILSQYGPRQEVPRVRCRQPNHVARADQSVLDCILVEPNEWWIGWHVATMTQLRWPGGIPVRRRAAEAVSRAYWKLGEALDWSHAPLQAGDVCFEIGSAPGGAAQALLERGCQVFGIDPAEMDEQVLEHPSFTHLRQRAADVRRRTFQLADWLLADANVAPKHTLDSVEAIVNYPGVRPRGLILTLKLPDYKLAGAVPQFLDRIRGWGFAYVRARQLAFNRQEICVVALRNRAARRPVAPRPAVPRATRVTPAE